MSVPRGAPAPESSALRIGSARIDVDLREIRSREGAGPVRRVTPKAMGVLLALAARPGQVVGRDELLATVWPDTLPTDDVLTQAVTQLRKAFRAACGPDECIQTIAKGGYRLLAPVVWESAAPAAPVMAAPPATPDAAAAPVALGGGAPSAVRPPPRRTALWLGAAAVLALVAALGLWQLRPASQPSTLRPAPAGTLAATAAPTATPPAVTRLTSAPGAESSPTLTADGTHLAFVAVPTGADTTAIHVQATQSATATVLTRPTAPAADDSPAFSPDGQRIAYRRSGPDGRCEVRIVDANGLADRRVAPCPAGAASGLDWSPDASRLVAAHAADPAQPTRLQVLDLASGRWTRIETGARGEDVEALPRFTPAGDALVLVRNPQDAVLMRVPLAGGTPHPLARLRVDLRGWAWLPDAGQVLLSHFEEGEFRLARAALAGGRHVDLGLASAQQPAVAMRARRLAFVESSASYALQHARWPAGGPSAHVLEPVLRSTGRDLMPALAPDGDQLLFVSTRSGPRAVWWARMSDPASLRRVEGVVPRARHAPVWSLDGRHALLPAVDAQGRGQLMEFDAATGTARVLAVPGGEPVQAAYGGQGEVLVVVAGDPVPRLLRFDRRQAPWRLLGQWHDAARVRVAAGRVWFSRTGRPGLWSLDIDLRPGSLRLEDASRPGMPGQRLWELDAAGRPWLLGQEPGCMARLRPIGRGAPAAAGRCLDARHRAAFNGFALAADARSALFAGVSDEQADIVLVPLAPRDSATR